MTDWQLIAAAAAACHTKGVTVPVPHLVVRILSRFRRHDSKLAGKSAEPHTRPGAGDLARPLGG